MKHLIAATIIALAGFTAVAGGKPNFIVIMGDDVGWDAFGCTGMKEARTPAIDKLANVSCMMDRFYCSVSQCAPLRAELYTGLLPYRNGVLANAKKVKRPGVKNVAEHRNRVEAMHKKLKDLMSTCGESLVPAEPKPRKRKK